MNTCFVSVPCNGCRLCCQNDAVRLLPGDRLDLFIEPHPMLPGQWMIAHKENGDCHYLGEKGCTIQDNKPKQCQRMDCRPVAAHIGKRGVARMSGHARAILQRGLDMVEHPEKFSLPCLAAKSANNTSNNEGEKYGKSIQ